MELTVEAAFNFLELPFAERVRARRIFSSASPLVRDELLTLTGLGRRASPREMLDARVQISNRTFSWVTGDALPEGELLEVSSLEMPRANFSHVVLPEDDRKRILSVVEHHESYLRARQEWGFDEVIRYGKGLMMLFAGPPGTGKTMTAHAVAHRLGKQVLQVDVPTFASHAEGDRFLPALFREARLQDAVLFFDECEALFTSRERGGGPLMSLLLTELERFEGVAILATNLPEHLDPALDRRVLVRVAFPDPDASTRAAIWRKHFPPRAPIADDVDVPVLARRFAMSGGYIKNAVLAAIAGTVHRGEDQITMATLVEAAQAQLIRLSDVASGEAEHPTVALKDVAVPSELRTELARLARAARVRQTLWERPGIRGDLGAAPSISALLHGPMGTGKRACADAIAHELQRPVVRAALGEVLSSRLGETEAKLRDIFRQAHRTGSVLVLEEVDAVFEANDELTPSFARRWRRRILRSIEQHDGLVLLLTESEQPLDPALHERVTWSLRFDAPDAASRSSIWRRMLPPSVTRASALDLDQLGRAYSLTNAEIQKVVMRAAFRAEREGGTLHQALLESEAKEARNDPLGDPLLVPFVGEA